MECQRCAEQIARNRTGLCRRCRNFVGQQYHIGQNNNDREVNEREENESNSQLFYNDNIINNHLYNPGYIDEVKQKKNLRIMALNPNGFGPKTIEKIEMMCQKVQELEIDMVLLSTPDRRWTTTILEQLRKRFR